MEKFARSGTGDAPGSALLECNRAMTGFVRKTHWFDAEAEQPSRVTEAEVADMACAGKNDQRTRQLGLSGGGHIAAWPSALVHRAVELTRFRGHLSFCSEGGAHHGKASQPISA